MAHDTPIWQAGAAGISSAGRWDEVSPSSSSFGGQATVRPDYFPIDSYGVIGDMHTLALVNPHGGIDWACFPIFDSPSSFARILDDRIGGTFTVSPLRFAASEQSYLPRTNILCTNFWSSGVTVSLVDFMPILQEDGSRDDVGASYVCREVSVRGEQAAEIEIEFDPSPDYARGTSFFDAGGDGRLASCGDLTLHASAPIVWDSQARIGRVTVAPGEKLYLALCAGSADITGPIETWFEDALAKTESYWNRWLDKCRYDGLWHDIVERSALALKLLTFKPTGAIIAAGTTSLPEGIGGTRNWDYRFCWLQNSAATLNALLALGFVEEAKEFVDWMLALRPDRDESMSILYSVSEIDTTEESVLSHLSGYRGSQPVRIGNAVRDQTQLDVYGEIIDTLFLFSKHNGRIADDAWDYVTELADRICQEWSNTDEGIWEIRADQQHFTHSKLLCWVGLDRALRVGRDHGLTGPFEHWESEKKKIRTFILDECVDPDGRYLTQSSESHAADASSLLASKLGFIEPDGEIANNTVAETLEQLTKDGRVYRYLTDDGLKGPEGAFNICTFWLVESLAMAGRLDEAHEIFRGMLELSNHLGLYAEQTDLNARIALGNFPQAFSHVGLINSALMLDALVQCGSGRAPSCGDHQAVEERVEA
jgi:GH15 family glucan-1,4-alpha-glucosidase